MIDKENVLFSEYGIANVTLQVGTIDSLGNEKKKKREEKKLSVLPHEVRTCST